MKGKENQEERDVFCITEETSDSLLGWYFSDEIQQRHGPFETIEETIELYRKYVTQSGSYSREELEKLATEKPNELALIFAQKVAGFPDANLRHGMLWKNRDHSRPSDENSNDTLPDYLTDLTAVNNVAKAQKLIWQMVHSRNSGRIFQCFKSFDGPETHCCQQPNWPDCAALMIIMIEVEQGHG